MKAHRRRAAGEYGLEYQGPPTMEQRAFLAAIARRIRERFPGGLEGVKPGGLSMFIIGPCGSPGKGGA